MQLNGRKVIEVGVDGVDPSDYPDFCDAYFTDGRFEDTGEPLTDSELNELQDAYPEVLNEMAFEKYL